jgi:hypothetical protein
MDERMGFDSEILVYLHWHGVKFINLNRPEYFGDSLS